MTQFCMNFLDVNKMGLQINIIIMLRGLGITFLWNYFLGKKSEILWKVLRVLLPWEIF